MNRRNFFAVLTAPLLAPLVKFLPKLRPEVTGRFLVAGPDKLAVETYIGRRFGKTYMSSIPVSDGLILPDLLAAELRDGVLKKMAQTEDWVLSTGGS